MAVVAFLKSFGEVFQRNVDDLIRLTLLRRFPPDYCLSFVENEEIYYKPQTKKFNLKDLLNDAFLWAVPKSRRTIERRHKRRYGIPGYHLKLILPKTNLQVCNVCGDDHEIGVLCPTCYKKVMDETKEMKDNIQNELGLQPVENEVVVLYEGEKDEKPAETWQGKRIVEMKKERPSWFSRNLLQKTTQQPATTKDVKPSDLG
ncbi:39S ribosomal protein L32, mitochondrial [Agrilus planipennis]|uniref:Large ribosomal subunit protein bL32m n=1 Tax=Agrilus planipennis TaxID=224129 RepID=A0A1W4W5C7_AGRPL|nr:39S ribosomal protein L32, mitochondrial [Agrilus planipennis]